MNDGNLTRKYELGNIELPYTVQVRPTPTSRNWLIASLLAIDEEDWTGTIKWDSTKETEVVSLNLIENPAGNMGSIWNTGSRRSRSSPSPKLTTAGTNQEVSPQLKPSSSTSSSKKRKKQTPSKKCSITPQKRNVKRKKRESSITSSDSYEAQCQKKKEELMELFGLPADRSYSQEEINSGFIKALLSNIKTHEDANEAQR